jgi:hypothetical protein
LIFPKPPPLTPIISSTKKKLQHGEIFIFSDPPPSLFFKLKKSHFKNQNDLFLFSPIPLPHFSSKLKKSHFFIFSDPPQIFATSTLSRIFFLSQTNNICSTILSISTHHTTPHHTT